jgi:hypothetical protein
MIKKIIVLSLFLFLCLGFFSVDSVLAGGDEEVVLTVSLDNPIQPQSIPVLIGYIINAVLGIVGSVALIMFVYGGIVWMTAGGNEQSITKGRNILMWAAVGIVVIFSSYALVRFVIGAITE